MAKSNNEMSGWVGWIGFASFMLLLMGAFSVIAGFVALFKDDVVYHSATNSTWILDYTQWGWVHILAGVLAILAAGSLMSGNMFGRITAVVVAMLSAIANMAFVPVYPIWSILVITINILVIWAVTVHGNEMKG
jgi:hypothetical protein